MLLLSGDNAFIQWIYRLLSGEREEWKMLTEDGQNFQEEKPPREMPQDSRLLTEISVWHKEAQNNIITKHMYNSI